MRSPSIGKKPIGPSNVGGAVSWLLSASVQSVRMGKNDIGASAPLRSNRERCGDDQGNCTTTSCGPPRRHTVIIAFSLPRSSVSPSNHHRSRFRVAVHAAHRAAAARAVGLLGDLAAGHARSRQIRARQPVGIILSGGPKSVSDAGRAEMRPGACSTLGSPVLGICYGMQLMARHARRPRRAGAAARVRPRDGHGRRPRRDRRGAVRRALPSESSACGRATATSSPPPPAGFAVVATSANAPVAGDGGSRARGSTRSCFIRKSCTPSAASRSCATSRTASAAAPATGRWRRLSRRRRRGSARRSGDGRVVCGAERRRRLDRRRADHSPRDRRSADVHLRRQRRAAARRGGADPQALRAAAAAAGVRRRVGAVPRAPRRRHRSGAEAEDHRRDVHRRVRSGGGEARPGRFPGAGHAVSRRDRVGRRSSGSRR